MERIDFMKALHGLELLELEELARIAEENAPISDAADYEQMIIEEYADFVADTADVFE